MTAVEWLEKQLDISNGYQNKIKPLFEKAKEMEKQQIIEAYDKGEFNCGMNESAEEYYNKTFKR
jgi:hypothetical protein